MQDSEISVSMVSNAEGQDNQDESQVDHDENDQTFNQDIKINGMSENSLLDDVEQVELDLQSSGVYT